MKSISKRKSSPRGFRILKELVEVDDADDADELLAVADELRAAVRLFLIVLTPLTPVTLEEPLWIVVRVLRVPWEEVFEVTEGEVAGGCSRLLEILLLLLVILLLLFEPRFLSSPEATVDGVGTDVWFFAGV